MHQRKSKKILIYFFLLIIVSTIGNNSINNLSFYKVQAINISGLDQKNNQILLNEIKNLKLENIFLINKNEIIKLINKNSLIEKYEVFKKYPYTINIRIEKTEFFAKINKNGKTYLIGSNGKLTFSDTDHKELPYVFGKPNINEFIKFKKIVDSSEFTYYQIKDLYYFPSKRWDLKLKNNILLKLPNNFSKETLDLLYKFLESYEGENFSIIDARISNQIILNG